MSATETPTTEGRITRWSLGGVDEWATLHVDLGVIDAKVVMSSREAREFAIAVLTDQGPYLGYQPPNETMREDRRVRSFGSGRDNGRVGWRERQKVDRLVAQLSDLHEQFGDEALGYALRRLGLA